MMAPDTGLGNGIHRRPARWNGSRRLWSLWDIMQRTASRMTGDGRLFEDAYAALAAMQNPWRNATMHLDQKYTEEEAAYIFTVVRGFMGKLAARCDENGLPKA
jgi:hypothetical protein